jgi:DNA polymerase-3 subunit gamma/tau
MPTLGRAWQMLLKGAQEVEQAPDRRAAAEMVLIRLCYVADLPPPGELVRRLTETQAAGARGPAGPVFDGVKDGGASDGGGARAVANGAPLQERAPDAVPAPEPAPAGPRLESFRDVAMLVAERREPVLHGLLLHSVHLVRFAAPVIELRPEPDAPRDLAPRLAALLLEATGTRWTIALSRQAGEPTLAEQAKAADVARRGEAALHPLVRAILEAFPGAKIASVTDSRADAYGLVDAPMLGDGAVLEEGAALEEGDGREFAPLDADDEDFVPPDAAEPM